MGRPTKLTDELREAICDHLEKTGCTFEIAAQAEGVDPRRLYEWQEKGRAGQEPYLAFAQDVARARARWELEALRKLEDIEAYVTDKKAAAAFARAISWKLERTRNDRYGAQITHKIEEAKDGLMRCLVAVCDRLGTPQVVDALLDELERDGPPLEGPEGGPARIH